MAMHKLTKRQKKKAAAAGGGGSGGSGLSGKQLLHLETALAAQSGGGAFGGSGDGDQDGPNDNGSRVAGFVLSPDMLFLGALVVGLFFVTRGG